MRVGSLAFEWKSKICTGVFLNLKQRRVYYLHKQLIYPSIFKRIGWFFYFSYNYSNNTQTNHSYTEINLLFTWYYVKITIAQICISRGRDLVENKMKSKLHDSLVATIALFPHIT